MRAASTASRQFGQAHPAKAGSPLDLPVWRMNGTPRRTSRRNMGRGVRSQTEIENRHGEIIDGVRNGRLQGPAEADRPPPPHGPACLKIHRHQRVVLGRQRSDPPQRMMIIRQLNHRDYSRRD